MVIPSSSNNSVMFLNFFASCKILICIKKAFRKKTHYEDATVNATSQQAWLLQKKRTATAFELKSLILDYLINKVVREAHSSFF